MNILFCSGEAEKGIGYNTCDSLITAFKNIGHNVMTCGPLHGNYQDDGILKGTKDIKVYDKHKHPETYDYDEILEQCSKKPDLIIQCDTNFYFTGEKPKAIPCVYYIVDIHRGADVFRRMALRGQFDYVFTAQKFFIPLLKRKSLNVYWLPVAFDYTYIKEYPEIDIQCDISFIGETGLSDELKTWPEFDEEIGINYHSGPYENIPHERRYRSWDNHSMEYAERAEILIRLSRDYDLRVYENSHKTRGSTYAKILTRGKVIINHSVWKDSNQRLFESLATKRNLVSDMVPFQNQLLQNNFHYLSYNQYFIPYLSNFDLEYEEIREKIDQFLSSNLTSKIFMNKGYDFVHKYHTFKNRAQTIIDTIENKVDGYQHPVELE